MTTDAEASAFEQLAGHLDWSVGATVSFVFADDPDLVQRLRERAIRQVEGQGGKARFLHPLTPQALREVIRELLGSRRKLDLVWLEAIGAGRVWADAWNDVLVRLNERREKLRRSLSGSLVLVAPVSAKGRFREAAPDLWSIRSLALELPATHLTAASPPPDQRAARINGYRVAEAVLRFQFHRRMRSEPWFALVVSDDATARRRLLDALVERGVAVLVHASPSDALTRPTEADAHWVLVDDDPSVRLLSILAGEGPALSRPTLLEGSLHLLHAIEGRVPDLYARVAFVVKLHPERTFHPGPLPTLDRAEGLVRDVWDALDRARVLEQDLAALHQRADSQRAARGEGKLRSDRVRELLRAAEALLAQGWSAEAQPLVSELHKAAGAMRPHDPDAARLFAESEEIAGKVAFQRGDKQEAITRYAAALPVRRRLARSRSTDERLRRRAELARCLSTLGELALDTRQLDSADAWLREALAIRRRLARASDDRETLSDLGTSWSLLGELLLARHEVGDGQLKAATDAFREALWIRERIASEEETPRFRRFLSVALGKLGKALAKSDDWDGARRCWERAAELALALVRLDPTNPSLRSDASVTTSQLGDALRAQGDAAGAYAAYREAADQRRRLLAEDPDSARNQELLAVALGRLAEAAGALDELEEALRASGRAVELSDHLVWIDPGNLKWRRGLATAHLRHGDLLTSADHPFEGVEAWRQALGVAEQLLDSGTSEGRRLARDVLAGLEARGVSAADLGPLRDRAAVS
ncbi:MAG: tetratricopeptide repeat protein [Myxococcota bacterium]